jgi:nucleotidyltransferase/DNA polymerase involved in DNA repair
MERRILFAEAPSFYASVERAQDPALVDRPVLVGGDPRKRGRVQSATRDALALGVEIEMPMLEALKCCPQARVLRTDMTRYRDVSRRLFSAFRALVPRLEPFGLAGMYGELPGSSSADDDEQLATALREAVRRELGLPVRVGIASGKFVARLATEEIEEEGFVRLRPEEESDFLAPLPVTRLDGVGRKTAATLAELGAATIGEVRALGRDRLQEAFGVHGLRIYANATGAGGEPIRATSHPQSISREATVRGESLDVAVLAEQLGGLAHQLALELARQQLVASKITLKLRFADGGTTTTRTQTLATPAASAQVLLQVAEALLTRTPAGIRPVRGIGLQLSALAPVSERDRQLSLFSPSED